MSRIIEAQAGAALGRRPAVEMGRLLAAHVRAEAAKPEKSRANASRICGAAQMSDAPCVGPDADVEKRRSGRGRRLELKALLFHRFARPFMIDC